MHDMLITIPSVRCMSHSSALQLKMCLMQSLKRELICILFALYIKQVDAALRHATIEVLM